VGGTAFCARKGAGKIAGVKTVEERVAQFLGDGGAEGVSTRGKSGEGPRGRKARHQKDLILSTPKRLKCPFWREK